MIYKQLIPSAGKIRIREVGRFHVLISLTAVSSPRTGGCFLLCWINAVCTGRSHTQKQRWALKIPNSTHHWLRELNAAQRKWIPLTLTQLHYSLMCFWWLEHAASEMTIYSQCNYSTQNCLNEKYTDIQQLITCSILNTACWGLWLVTNAHLSIIRTVL